MARAVKPFHLNHEEKMTIEQLLRGGYPIGPKWFSEPCFWLGLDAEMRLLRPFQQLFISKPRRSELVRGAFAIIAWNTHCMNGPGNGHAELLSAGEKQIECKIAMVCSAPPEERRRWLFFGSKRGFKRKIVPHVDRETIRILLESHDLQAF